MTDIYLNADADGRWKKLLPWLLLLLLGIGLLFWVRGGKNEAPDDTEPAAQEPSKEEPLSTDSTLEETTPASDLDLSPLDELVSDRRWPQARDLAFDLLKQTDAPRTIRALESRLSEIHTAMLTTKAPMEEKVFYVVKSGDTLGKIANTYGTTADSIAHMNNIRNNLIRVGERIQILRGDFSVTVHKSLNEMVVTLNDRFFKRYRVGTGADSSTPTGEYVITLRIRHPVWYRPDGQQIPYGDPENLLGTHYLKLDVPGYGLHGTWEPQTVGSQSSAGCVRLTNDDIYELYHLLPEETPVRITD